MAQLVKNPSAMLETWVWSLGWDDPQEKGKATHSSILAWRIPWTVESMGSQRVGHDWTAFTSLSLLGNLAPYQNFTSKESRYFAAPVYMPSCRAICDTSRGSPNVCCKTFQFLHTLLQIIHFLKCASPIISVIFYFNAFCPSTLPHPSHLSAKKSLFLIVLSTIWTQSYYLFTFLILLPRSLLLCSLCFHDFSYCMFQGNFKVYVLIQTSLLNFNKCLKWLLMPPDEKLWN